jgi:hypothetical protein
MCFEKRSHDRIGMEDIFRLEMQLIQNIAGYTVFTSSHLLAAI